MDLLTLHKFLWNQCSLDISSVRRDHRSPTISKLKRASEAANTPFDGFIWSQVKLRDRWTTQPAGVSGKVKSTARRRFNTITARISHPDRSPPVESVPDFIGQVLVVMHSRVRYCRGMGGGGGGCRSSRGRSLAAAQGGSRNSRSKAFRGAEGGWWWKRGWGRNERKPEDEEEGGGAHSTHRRVNPRVKFEWPLTPDKVPAFLPSVLSAVPFRASRSCCLCIGLRYRDPINEGMPPDECRLSYYAVARSRVLHALGNVIKYKGDLFAR